MSESVIVDVPKKPKILVAIPNTGQIHVRLAEKLLEMAMDPNYQIHIFFPFPPQIPHDSARNFISKVFLDQAMKHDFDFLLQIDADVIPPKNILDMAKNNLPVCSGVCFVWNGDEIVPTAANTFNKDGKRVKPKGVRISDSPTDVMTVDYVGGGCVMIRRDMLEKFRETKTIPYAFDYDKDGIMWQGEDYHFCEVVRNAGYTVHVDRRFICGHYKTVDLYWLNGLLQKYWKEGGHHTPTPDGDRNDHGGTDAGEDPASTRGTAG